MTKKMGMMTLVKTQQRRCVTMPIDALAKWADSVLNQWHITNAYHTEFAGDDVWLDRHGIRYNLRDENNDLVAYVWIEE